MKLNRVVNNKVTTFLVLEGEAVNGIFNNKVKTFLIFIINLFNTFFFIINKKSIPRTHLRQPV